MAFVGVLVAAGSGERLGAEVPKALITLGGRPLVRLAHDALVAAGARAVVVAAPADHRDEIVALLRHGDATRVVVGAATRAGSVRAALAAVPAGDDLVAIHDAARALAPVAVIRAAVAAVTGDVLAAAPALPVADTLKQVDGDRVVATVPRDDLVAVQTPQVFRRDVLAAAHATADDATDDLGLVEACLAAGTLTGRIVVTPGSVHAMKITYPHDLAVAAALQQVPA